MFASTAATLGSREEKPGQETWAFENAPGAKVAGGAEK